MEHNKDAFFITFADSINDDKVKSLIAVVSDILVQHHPSFPPCVLRGNNP